jgi:hypothetical protein
VLAHSHTAEAKGGDFESLVTEFAGGKHAASFRQAVRAQNRNRIAPVPPRVVT